MKHFKNIQNFKNYYEADSKHPLIDVLKYEDVRTNNIIKNEPIQFEFYKISFVKNFNGYIEIGDTKFDGDNGILHFVEPGQTYTCNSTNPWEGFQILIHPDIFKENFTQKKISNYDFFSYEVNESLLLTNDEKRLVNQLLEMTWEEFNKNNDEFSIAIILSYVSTLLNLTERFYARQFFNRKKLCNQLSKDFFFLLKNYYKDTKENEVGQPSVMYFAEKLNVTPNYLSDTIRFHSGQSALAIIHDFIIEEAKLLLLNSTMTVSQIAFQLGFEYANYFSRLFKRKMKVSPTEFRKSVKSI